MTGKRSIALLLVSLMMCALAAAGEPLWMIGVPDKDYKEFAGVGRVNEFPNLFPKPVVFTVGKSVTNRDWPFIHPSQADGWAGHRQHSFTIQFDLEVDPDGTPWYELGIHLVSAHYGAPPKISLKVNGQTHQRTVQTEAGRGDGVLADKNQGTFQVFRFIVPATDLVTGSNRLAIQTQGSWLLYDAVTFAAVRADQRVDKLNARVLPCWYRSNGQIARKLQIDFDGGYVTQPSELKVFWDDKLAVLKMNPRDRILSDAEFLLPMTYTEEPKKAKVVLEQGYHKMSQPVTIAPYRKWEVHLVHQTHLDIGYTHTQQEVLERQVRQLKEAMDLADATRDYPEEARFKWHPEGMWAVEEYLRTASAAEKERFIAATRRGDIHLDVMYAQAMTGIYSEEELFELMASAKRFEKQYGVTINSAMQTDVPGYTWGLVPALAQCGVKYISVGPNWGHRIGHTYEWGDRPFYWVSPSGRDKVLFWMCGRGYSLFLRSGVAQYHGLEDNHLLKYIDDVHRYLDELEEKAYPYDMLMLRYSIGSDNGPPDPTLCDAVRHWNERVAYPRFVITTNSAFLQAFEKAHGDSIPKLRGDFTPYWEDGAASTAADTALNRRTCERLVQAQVLWSLTQPELPLHEKVDAAWEKVMMYDEHTWGAWNSISAPDEPFVAQQAEYKQRFALDGQALTEAVVTDALADRRQQASHVVDVVNTHNWVHSALVRLSPAQSKAGDRVETEDGVAVVSQRLASGELAFQADHVPALGSRRFVVRPGKAHVLGSVRVDSKGLSSDRLSLTVNPKTGAIQSLTCSGVTDNLVDGRQGHGVNDYLYILERDAAKNQHRIEGPVKIFVPDSGPLVGSLRIECPAPGANSLIREITLVDGSDTVTLINTVDKRRERRPESVSFDFPWNVPDGVMKIDTPFASVVPEKDQLPGANRNFFCVQRWVDVSNNDYGVTWVSLDAPIVQWDPLKFSISWHNKTLFRSKLEPTQTFHSWVMNNHWETNYKADQEGPIRFAYAVIPHNGPLDAEQAQRRARAIHQPLVVVSVSPETVPLEAPVQVGGPGVVLSMLRPARDRRGWVMRLYNGTDQATQATVRLVKEHNELWLSNPMEERLRQLPGSIDLAAYDIVTLRVQ